MIAHQGESPGGELDPDLMAPSGMEPDPHKTLFALCQPGELEPGCLDAAPLALDHEDLVPLAVLPEKIFPVPGLGRGAVDHCHIFFYHRAFLHRFGQLCSRLLCPGEDHNAAHILVQPMDGENLAPKLFLQGGGKFMLGIKPHRLDADDDLLVGK